MAKVTVILKPPPAPPVTEVDYVTLVMTYKEALSVAMALGLTTCSMHGVGEMHIALEKAGVTYDCDGGNKLIGSLDLRDPRDNNA